MNFTYGDGEHKRSRALWIVNSVYNSIRLIEEYAEVENKQGLIYGQNKQGQEVEQIEKLEIVA